MEGATRRADAAAGENDCIRMGWTVAAAAPAGDRTGRGSHHTTVADGACLCDTVKRLSLATFDANERGQAKRRQDEARTGAAAAVAGGKIVAAGDSPGRPGRAGSRTSLEGSTVTLKKT